MRNFLQLARPDMGNQNLNLAPVQNALEQWGQTTQRNALMEQRQQEQAYQRGRDQKQDARADETWKVQNLERLGKSAFAYSQLPQEQRDPATWGRMVKAMQGFDPSIGTEPDDLDPIRGPAKFAAVYGGQVRDPREDKLMDLKLRGAEADLAKAARGLAPEYREVDGRLIELAPGAAPREVYAAPPKPDPVKDMLLERMRRGRGGTPVAAPAAPGIAPMSFSGGDTSPGITLIDDRAAAAEPAPPAPDMEPNTIDTPYGPMSREEAQELGGAMLLDPKYAAAGKALLESLKAGKWELSKPATTQLEERTISAASTLGRLQEIRRLNRPQFQQIPNKLKLYGASWGAAMGAKLSPELQRELGDFARYKLTAYDNFNQLLKELSGTAVSAQELARQKIVQPNPGEGPLDGDDPVTFESKIEQGERVARMAIARMNFMRNRGIDFNKDTAERFLRLDDVPAAIDRRGAEVEAELKRTMPGADPMSIEREAEKIVRREFGI